MRKVFSITLMAVGCFFIESMLSELVGRWFRPNLLIMLVVFFNLSRGIRYSLFAAFVAGLLKDSLGTNVFGLNIFSFMLCAYLTTFIKMYIYHPGSGGSRILLVFVMAWINIAIYYVMNTMFVAVSLGDMFFYLLLPELFATTVLSTYVLKKFKQCALRLFV